MPLVYDELRRLARRRLRGERHNTTLEPTALVHDVFLRLVKQDKVSFQKPGAVLRFMCDDHASHFGRASASSKCRLSIRQVDSYISKQSRSNKQQNLMWTSSRLTKR